MTNDEIFKGFLCVHHGGSPICVEKNSQLGLQCPKCEHEIVRSLKEELEEELERRATSHPVDQVDESLEKGHPVFPGDSSLRSYGCVGDHPIQFVGLPDPPLSFVAYQDAAKKTAIYNQDARVMYPALGLSGEVGEFIEKAGGITAGVDVLLNGVAVCAGKCANQVKKIIRDDDCECDTPRKHAIGQEIGGVLWYCAAVASDLGLSLSDIAQENLDILDDRKKRGTIKGDGDNR